MRLCICFAPLPTRSFWGPHPTRQSSPKGACFLRHVTCASLSPPIVTAGSPATTAHWQTPGVSPCRSSSQQPPTAKPPPQFLSLDSVLRLGCCFVPITVECANTASQGQGAKNKAGDSGRQRTTAGPRARQSPEAGGQPPAALLSLSEWESPSIIQACLLSQPWLFWENTFFVTFEKCPWHASEREAHTHQPHSEEQTTQWNDGLRRMCF